MTPHSVLTALKPFTEQSPREMLKMAAKNLLAPTVLGWLGSAAVSPFTSSWTGGAVGLVVAIAYLCLHNVFSERRGVLAEHKNVADRLEKIIAAQGERYETLITQQAERHRESIREERDQRHEMANALNKANMAMVLIMQSIGAEAVDRELLLRAITIYTTQTEPAPAAPKAP